MLRMLKVFLLLDALRPDIRERILLEVDEADLIYDRVMNFTIRLASWKLKKGTKVVYCIRDIYP